MNPAATLSIVAAVVGVGVALLGLSFGSAPGWGRYRILGAVGLTAAAYAALDVFFSVRASDGTRVVALHVQAACAALHVACWQSYVRHHLGAPPRPVDRAIMGMLLVLAALWLVPGLMSTRVIASLEVPWLGVTYRFPEATALGSLSYALETAALALPLARYLRAMRAGLADARLHALALGIIFVAAINDTLTTTKVIVSPMLLSVAFVAAVGALGSALTRAFVDSARELDRLSRSLEDLVAERTRALVETEAALHRTEKMAAIGQLAAGVAHEINNPGAAVEANLAYLREALQSGELPPDAGACLDESLEGVARITKIVGQLLDSGRAAAQARSGNASASVLRAVQQALASSRPRVGDHVATSVDVPPTLFVRADESSLVQVLVNLLVNAAQAIPSDRGAGRVTIRTSTDGGRVAVDVIDDGAGMSEETQRRLFEPFFTTKPRGRGTGLGLAVSLGLVRSMGGDLQVASTSKGTCMKIILDVGEADSLSPPTTELLEIARRVRD